VGVVDRCSGSGSGSGPAEKEGGGGEAMVSIGSVPKVPIPNSAFFRRGIIMTISGGGGFALGGFGAFLTLAGFSVEALLFDLGQVGIVVRDRDRDK
jgi:hypothetical protein